MHEKYRLTQRILYHKFKSSIGRACPPEQDLKKLTDFFDKGLIQRIDMERFLFDQMIPCEWEAL
jgi:hypothetical protein